MYLRSTGKRQVWTMLGVVVVSSAFALFNGGKAWARNCTAVELQDYIRRFEQADISALEAAEQCSPNPPTIDALVKALQPGNENRRIHAALALGTITKGTAVAVPALRAALNDPQGGAVRRYAIDALAEIGSPAKPAFPDVLKALQDPDPKVGAAAAIALVWIGDDPKEIRQALIAALDSPLNGVQSTAADSLGSLGVEAKEAIKPLLGLLKDDNRRVRSNTAIALGKISAALRDRATTLQQVNETLDIVAGIDKATSDPEFAKVKQPIVSTLAYLKLKQNDLWWQEAKRWIIGEKAVWLVQPLGWLVLMFAYPRSPRVQAMFFWNPWVRKFAGLGYVGSLLILVPFLGRRLFSPFKASLLADAGLDQFDPAHYFADSEVQFAGTTQSQPLKVAIPIIKGQIVLEGDSGLGKSMFLRHLIQHSQRVVVYLPAHKCEKGVIEAIQAKLHGQAQDPDFLRSLIYSGAIDLCIDGLNEVKAEVRATIIAFVESYFKGNIIMTTQPLEWTPPTTAKVYHLQPLKRDQIERFLVSRQFSLPADALVRDAAYVKACMDYLNIALNEQQPAEELRAAKRIFTNPMDLSIVAEMLGRGKQPNLFQLQEELYALMATEYQRLHLNQPFPLKEFAEATYQMRLKDEFTLPETGFLDALQCMARYKMVVHRQSLNEKGEAKQEWRFRHDTIMEFFIMQTFLGQGDEANERLKNHRGDPRFRGVYFLLATRMPLDAAQKLREELIQYAADTKDHNVSDTFIQLIRSRN